MIAAGAPIAPVMLKSLRTDRLPVRSMLVTTMTTSLLLGATAAPSQGAATKYKNCAALNKAYPHGVGRKGARDKTSGKPVTTFTVSASVYAANTGSDRDKDGIACEKA